MRYDAESGVWIVGRYADAVEVLRDTARFSSVQLPMIGVPGMRWRVHRVDCPISG